MSSESSARPAETAASLYDLVTYAGYARADTHPARMAAVGVLHGMAPAPVPRCRVLELGCGDAANLVAMAYQLPEARFVGIDLAGSAIARGRSDAAALGLANVELHVMDIGAASASLGEFDYIIAHGVYSWVPPEVREQLLALCRALLAPQGIAFVSYLAQPGTQMRDVLRDYLLRNSDAAADPAARVARARELGRAFGGGSTVTDPFQQAIQILARELDGWEDGQIFHDWLASYNAGMRITEFVAEASRFGLAFLGEAEYYTMCWQHDPALSAARSLLEAAEARSVLEKEQLLDELRCRRFRQTLLCRAGAPWSKPTPDRALRLAAASRLQPTGEIDLNGFEEAPFRSPHDVTVRVNHPVAKAALVELAVQYPRPIPGSELLARARLAAGRTDPGTEEADAQLLGELLLACAGSGLAFLTAWAAPLANRAGERPRASAVARAQLERSTRVTSLVHQNISAMEPIGRALLQLLDGSRSRTELIAELLRQIESGALPPPPPSDENDTDTDVRTRLERGLESSLAGLAYSALLEA
ncbi:MAG: methyltransferase domain-containing protein [Gemmatimonadetes bacterium]|nr:methyltransferase domain-containing protein [Gemmatimonadota bacterium]